MYSLALKIKFIKTRNIKIQLIELFAIINHDKKFYNRSNHQPINTLVRLIHLTILLKIIQFNLNNCYNLLNKYQGCAWSGVVRLGSKPTWKFQSHSKSRTEQIFFVISLDRSTCLFSIFISQILEYDVFRSFLNIILTIEQMINNYIYFA